MLPYYLGMYIFGDKNKFFACLFWQDIITRQTNITSTRDKKLVSILKYIEFSVFFIIARSFFLIQGKLVRQ